jgi:L-threonylcarbamoyladenylate synthase
VKPDSVNPAKICHDHRVKRLRIDTARPLGPQLSDAVAAIHSGAVVAFPTDTLYGLAADPRSASAVDAIFSLKSRAAGKGLPLIAADLDQIQAVAEMGPLARRLAEAFWPGPLTLLLRSTAVFAPNVCSAGGVVGVRVPDDEVARALARGAGHIVTATSANRSGQPATADPDVVARALPEVPVLVDAGLCRGGSPSTIVDLSDEPRLVRDGAIAWNRVLEFLGSPRD